ncbi:STAS/SEC14 domain-containing protein [Mongoliitalea daihaiensis]|uniref:STAS/SEC14 domain-containing protein n=1 Tax=Mongoliitalea daihaiensis TaxID=2782006 RepID=UPI001F2AF0F2|nr:STAS/SEC14 domain-containing protein [Mongoliitalea daihaiensis]UJP64343.1 STAS/SEC14 domain-containing protein [Mongoliitalea daihaiensis]
MEPYAIIDESSLPLVNIQFTGTKSTDENFQAYLQGTKDCYRNQEKLGIIFDASNASIPSLKHQQMQAAWLKENKNLMELYCVGTAYVIPSAAIRAILRVIFSFQKQPVPYEIFESTKEAKNWLESVFSKDLI